MINIDEDQKKINVEFEDLDVIGDQEQETFVLNLNSFEGKIPYYIYVDKFDFNFSGRSFLINGRSALLPNLIKIHENINKLTLLVERDRRFYIYVHQTTEV
jgi:hypothetical protein